MRLLAATALLAAAAHAGDGIAWTGDVNRTLDRARRNNQPILLAINALETETGNLAMVQRYKDKALVKATRPFLCLVASPHDHMRDGVCARFGSIPCTHHQEVSSWATIRHGTDGNLTSPGHFILGPDGRILWRQEFWIEARDLQRQLEIAIVKVSPRAALELAGNTREDEMQQLRAGQLNPATYVKSDDPLATAVLLVLYEDDEDAKWLKPLRQAPKSAFGLIRLFLEDDPELLPVALAVDPARAKWWAKYHGKSKAKVLPPRDRKLAAAWKKLQAGDRGGLERLLGALRHPVDGAEVRACLATLAGEDLGADPDRWREALQG